MRNQSYVTVVRGISFMGYRFIIKERAAGIRPIGPLISTESDWSVTELAVTLSKFEIFG